MELADAVRVIEIRNHIQGLVELTDTDNRGSVCPVLISSPFKTEVSQGCEFGQTAPQCVRVSPPSGHLCV